MQKEISNTDDVIDSRDVIERIEEIREQLQEINDKEGSGYSEEDYIALQRELHVLKALAEQGEEYAPDWQHGETLIRDSYFVDYVQELLEDCGDIPKNLPHYIHIDWQKTARDIRMDYTSIDFDGVTYWIR